MKTMLLIATGFLLSVGGAGAVPTGTTYGIFRTDSHNVFVGDATNIVSANGLVTTDQVANAFSVRLPPVQAYRVTWGDDSNTIVISDSEGSNPDAWGSYTVESPTNAHGWVYDPAMWLIMSPSTNCYSWAKIPDDLFGHGGDTTGCVHVAYGKLGMVTNSVTWSGVLTNIVGVSTQILQYGSFGNLTNALTLP